MSAENRIEVYRTGQRGDAEAVRELLGGSGIDSELAGEDASSDADTLDLAVLVHIDKEEEAVRLISEFLESQGLRPHEGSEGGVVDGPCPNCATAAAAGAECGECGYEVKASPEGGFVRARAELPDARGSCADCGALFTAASGPCPDCGGALEAVREEDLLCAERSHVLVKGDGEGWVCVGCRAAYLP